MTTANYAWSLPIVGGNQNQWGTMLNNILTDIDAKMFARTGGAISGNVSVTGDSSATGSIYSSTRGASAGFVLPDWRMYNTSSGNGLAWNNGSDRMILDANGNLGIGVTPAPASLKTVQVGNNTVCSYNDELYISSNAYYNGGWKYGSGTHAATQYFQYANQHQWFNSSGTIGLGNPITFTQAMTLDASGNLLPGANGTQAFGSTSLRWSQVWCTAGAFNTSDATLKTKVSKFNDAEIQAAVALSKEIGWFQWLDAVKEKGEEKARHHVGLTVQRAAEVLKSFGLDPWIYGFMSHDVWDDQITEHPAIEAVEAVLDEDGNEVTPAIEANDAWSEVRLKAGESYAFRYDQLNLFISRGLEARLSALEARA